VPYLRGLAILSTRPRGSLLLEMAPDNADDGSIVAQLSHRIRRIVAKTILMAFALACLASGYVKPLAAEALKGLKPPTLVLTPVEQLGDAPVEPTPPPYKEEDFNPFLFLMLIAFLVVCGLAVGAGAVAALVLLVMLGLLAGLIAAGMVSASVVIGVLRRSATTGFRALFLQIGGVVGLIMGSLGAWIFILLAKLPTHPVKPWVIGPIVGVVSGLAAAWMFNFAWGRSVEWIARKLPGRKMVEVETEKLPAE